MSEIVNPCAEREQLGPRRYRQTQHIKPIAYIKQGAWTRITNRLGPSGDPNLTVGVDELVQFRVRNRLSGNAPVVHFGKGQSMVRLTPLGTANVRGEMLGDNGWLYPEAWPHADLRLLIGGHILRKEVVLRTGHPRSFSWRIDSHQGLDYDTLQTPDFVIVNPTLERDGESIGLEWQKATQGGRLILTATLPDGDWAGWTLDPTLTLQPDAAAGIDTYVQSNLPKYNFGIAPSLRFFITLIKCLLKFDLSSIDPASTCTSATLSLYHTLALSPGASTVTWYSVALGNAAWVEGTENSQLARTGQPCWNALAADGAGGVQTPWAGSAGMSTSGTDYEASAIGSFSGNPADPVGTQYTAALNVARVAGWFGATNTNYGIVGITTVGSLQNCGASDYATAAYRPKLVVEYTAASTGAGSISPRRGGIGANGRATIAPARGRM